MGLSSGAFVEFGMVKVGGRFVDGQELFMKTSSFGDTEGSYVNTVLLSGESRGRLDVYMETDLVFMIADE